MTRRRCLAVAALQPFIASAAQSRDFRMPDEAEPHKKTWMAFGPSERIWGKELVPHVRKNLATNCATQQEPT